MSDFVTLQYYTVEVLNESLPDPFFKKKKKHRHLKDIQTQTEFYKFLPITYFLVIF